MFLTTFCTSIATAAALLFATTAFAADPPLQNPGDWTVKDLGSDARGAPPRVPGKH
jgi:hypothetical protein